MKYGVSCNLFLKPIHWFSYWTTSHDPSARVSTPATGPAQDESPPEQPADVRRPWPNTLAPGPNGSTLCPPPGTVNFICVVSIWIYDIVLGGVDRYEQGWTKYVQCLQNTWKQGCMTFLNLFLYLHLGAWYFYVCFVTVWWLRKLEIPQNCPKANGLGMSWGITRISTAWYLVSLVHHISIVLFFLKANEWSKWCVSTSGYHAHAKPHSISGALGQRHIPIALIMAKMRHALVERSQPIPWCHVLGQWFPIIFSPSLFFVRNAASIWCLYHEPCSCPTMNSSFDKRLLIFTMNGGRKPSEPPWLLLQ